jgi:Phytanoyl-CoA dioxygenase (PhyH)
MAIEGSKPVRLSISHRWISGPASFSVISVNLEDREHRDLIYRHFTSSRPLAASVLFCLDEFSDETGGTRILPGTQKVEVFPSEEFLKAHRSRHNKSGHVRRGLNHVYGLPFLKQQINIPDMLQGRYSGDVSIRRLFWLR